MPPNQDGSSDNSSLPTLPDSQTQSIAAMPPAQVSPVPPPPTQATTSSNPNDTSASQKPTIDSPTTPQPPNTINTQQQTSTQSNPPPKVTTAPHSHLFRNLLLLFLFFLITTPALALTLAYNNYPYFKPPQLIQKTLDNIIVVAPIPKPTRIILETTIARSAKLTSANQKTEFSFSTSAKNFPVSSVKVGISGPIEFTVQNKQAAEADINLEVKFEGATFTGSASIKQVNDTIYFKANEIPFGQFYQQLLDYKNKWYYYKIPKDYLPKKEEADSYAKVTKIVMDFVDKSQTWTKITSQDGNVYSLEIIPPKKDLDNFIFALVAAVEPKDQKQILTDLEKENFTKVTEKIKNLKITAKVNKDNYYLKTANISFDISADNLSLPSAAQTTLPITETTVFNVNISTELSDYNKQVVIVPPTDAQDFQKIIEDYTKKSGMDINKLENQTNDSQIKNDIGAIATALQANYTVKASQGQPGYVKELKNLEPDYLTSLPIPPLESGVEAYQYLKDPPTCDGTTTNACKEVALYAPLTSPATPGNVWCWQSITNKAQELIKDKCVAGNVTEQQSPQINIRSLIEPEQTVLGQKTNWELQTLHLFTQLFK